MTARKQRHLGIPMMYFVSNGKIHQHQVGDPRWNILREIRRKETLANSHRFPPRSPDLQPRLPPKTESESGQLGLFPVPIDDKLWSPEEMELEIKWNDQPDGDTANWFCDDRWNPRDCFEA
jgi:hypothetical protein